MKKIKKINGILVHKTIRTAKKHAQKIEQRLRKQARAKHQKLAFKQNTIIVKTRFGFVAARKAGIHFVLARLHKDESE